MTDPLYMPSREQIITTNAWAFLHWLRTVRDTDLPDWAALQRWSCTDQAAFGSAIAEFARLPSGPLRLVRHQGPQDALVLRRLSGDRIVLSRNDLLATGQDDNPRTGVPGDIAALLVRRWLPGLLIRPLADLLLHADLRPDDRLLVVGAAAWPWLAALLEGTGVVLAAAAPDTLLATVADEGASVLVAPVQTLADAAFQRARRRPDLARLRMIVASGGPLSPEGRTRIYTWIKSDLMLLARTGDTLWGNPLEPVLARPPTSPGFLTPPASDRETP
jgi:hypothetical protein